MFSRMHLFPDAVLFITLVSTCAASLLSIPLIGANRPSVNFKRFQPHRPPHRLRASTRVKKLLGLRNNIHRGPKPPDAWKTEFKRPIVEFDCPRKAEKPPVSRQDIELQRQNNMHYGKINVGTPGQEFNVTFDIGPSPMWILSIQSTLVLNWEKHQKYNFESSSTYISKGKFFQLKYSFGEVGGYISQDSVSVAGLTVVNQTFGEAIANLDVFADTVIDGVVGLGFRNISHNNETNLLDNMVSQGLLEAPVFSIYISRLGRGDRPSYLTLGGANPDFFTGDFTFVDLTVPHRWQFQMDRIQLFGGKYIFGNGGCQAEIRFSSSMLVGPYADVDRLNAKLGAKNSSLSGPYVLYEFDCSEVDNLPDVEFIINGKKLSLSSKDYVVKWFQEGSLVCLSAFRGRKDFTEGNESLWTLGHVFMRGFYTYFDKANSRVGFAKAKH